MVYLGMSLARQTSSCFEVNSICTLLCALTSAQSLTWRMAHIGLVKAGTSLLISFKSMFLNVIGVCFVLWSQ
jgi:hypothetical protein